MRESAPPYFDWQQALATPVLPVSPAIKEQALQKLASNTANANNLSHILIKDPALCLPIISSANRSLAASGNECQSLTHAISLLGFPQLEDLIQSSPDHDDDVSAQSTDRHQGYQQQLLISQHAAHQAEAWAALNPYWPAGSAYWPTLFRQAPLWALWHNAPEAMQRWQALRAKYRGAHPQHLEEPIFGERLNHIALRASQQWYLPTHSQHSWQPDIAGTATEWTQLSRATSPLAQYPDPQAQPDLHALTSRQPFLVALANEFAEATDWDWYSRHTLRLQNILATALNKPLSDVIQLQHQQAVSFSQLYPTHRARLPAQQLFSFERKWERLQQALTTHSTLNKSPLATTGLSKPSSGKPLPISSVETSPTESTASKLSATEQLLEQAPSGFAACILRLKQLDSFKDIHELMNFAVTSLCEEADFERASISLLNIKNRELRTFYSSGTVDSPMLKNFRHTLRKGDLLNKLLQKPLSVRLHRGNYSQLWPLLPGNFKQASGADELVMMSIFVKQKPFGLIYADKGISNRSLNDQHYSYFKQLCNGLTPCIEHILSRAR